MNAHRTAITSAYPGLTATPMTSSISSSAMFAKHNRCDKYDTVNRIEFEYVD